MTRETRFNLVFLIVILALLVPAGVLVFISRLRQSTARPLSMPEPVPRLVAYMSPNAIPPGMRRVAPPHTLHWVQTVARQQVGADNWNALLCPRDAEDLPLMSDHRAFQVIALSLTEADLAVWVMFWNQRPAPDGVIWTWGPKQSPAALVGSETIAIPHLVRDEMGDNQIFIPPKTVLVQKIVVPAGAPMDVGSSAGRAIDLQARLTHGQIESVRLVPLSTNDAATRNYVEKR